MVWTPIPGTVSAIYILPDYWEFGYVEGDDIWSAIAPAQTPGYSQITPVQTPGWTEVIP